MYKSKQSGTPCAASLHVHPHHKDPEADEGISKDSLWVVTAISNPMRYKSRYALYEKFRKHVLEDLGLGLITVETAFGDRQHRTGTEAHPRAIDVKVRNHSFVWLKENMWNIGARYLPESCKYVLFCDADIHFYNRFIGTEIVHALQEYKIVQPFQTAADLGPSGEIIGVHRSFGFAHVNGEKWNPKTTKTTSYTNSWHPGFAMAMRRSVLDKLPVLDVGVLGSGDHHMMASLIGKAELTLPAGIHPNYAKRVLAWQSRAADVVNGSLGYVSGTILHAFHGSKTNRKYVSRWKILVDHAYDPDTCSYFNSQGVLELESRAAGLRDAIRKYFAERNEDE